MPLRRFARVPPAAEASVNFPSFFLRHLPQREPHARFLSQARLTSFPSCGVLFVVAGRLFYECGWPFPEKQSPLFLIQAFVLTYGFPSGPPSLNRGRSRPAFPVGFSNASTGNRTSFPAHLSWAAPSSSHGRQLLHDLNLGVVEFLPTFGLCLVALRSGRSFHPVAFGHRGVPLGTLPPSDSIPLQEAAASPVLLWGPFDVVGRFEQSRFCTRAQPCPRTALFSLGPVSGVGYFALSVPLRRVI